MDKGLEVLWQISQIARAKIFLRWCEECKTCWNLSHTMTGPRKVLLAILYPPPSLVPSPFSNWSRHQLDQNFFFGILIFFWKFVKTYQNGAKKIFRSHSLLVVFKSYGSLKDVWWRHQNKYKIYAITAYKTCRGLLKVR